MTTTDQTTAGRTGSPVTGRVTRTDPGPRADGARDFPPDFLWGAATAAFQIEGAAAADGRTPSIWDTFCRVPGAVANGDDGDVACDHYHRWPEDLGLLTDLGLGAYRFSVAWPRIQPGPGARNQAGLDFYSRLVDGMLERGLEPWLTLYHWDLPQWVEDAGGWPSRDTVDRFVDYALTVHGVLGDRVRRWTTLNEPWCSAYLGYSGGQHAPGRQEPEAAVRANHHLLLAHGRAVRALRAADPSAELGIVLNMTVADPADPMIEADVAAAERFDALQNGVFAEPLFRGRYPEPALRAWADLGLEPPVVGDDLEVIATPLDLLGINYYNGAAVSATPPEADVELPSGAAVARPTSEPMVGLGEAYVVSRGLPRTAMDWEVQPDGLRRLLLRVHEEWAGPAGVPVYVTENGAAFDDVVAPDGTVTDPGRVGYLMDHLAAVRDARAGGADVRGYFVWSLLDNFEWAYGYDKRFGVVHVDFATQRRTPKASALAFGEVARTGTLPVVSGATGASPDGPAGAAPPDGTVTP